MRNQLGSYSWMGSPVLRLTNHNLFRCLGYQLIRRRMLPLTTMSVVTTTMPGVIQELMTGVGIRVGGSEGGVEVSHPETIATTATTHAVSVTISFPVTTESFRDALEATSVYPREHEGLTRSRVDDDSDQVLILNLRIYPQH